MNKIIKNRIVVIGGNGFIGSHLVSKLKELGINNILIFDRGSSLSVDGAEVVSGDFCDVELLNKILIKEDIVIHLACTTTPLESEENIESDIEQNVIGSVKLLKICQEKKINKFIFMSSGGTVYGDHGNKAIKEDDLTNPVNAHGVMKLSIEKYIQVFNNLFGLKYLIFRIGNPYGRFLDQKRKQGVIDIFLKKAVNNEVIEVWGDGNVVRDFIYIDDLIYFIINVIKKDISNEIFNIGSGKGFSINQILKIIERVVGNDIKIKYINKRNFDVQCNILDIKKAQKFINWRPRVELESGIRKIYNQVLN